ncbi:MAG: hypothetical protein HC895_16140 [Leptolyngbyaceae cyanobacterium SM1_3_5]|nr:hypothetical protein [Leptolyngbyaceae cyanobacterium SM1_3_5]
MNQNRQSNKRWAIAIGASGIAGFCALRWRFIWLRTPTPLANSLSIGLKRNPQADRWAVQQVGQQVVRRAA